MHYGISFAIIKIAKRETAKPPVLIAGGDNMEHIEVYTLLNLLAVVIFGIINIMRKK